MSSAKPKIKKIIFTEKILMYKICFYNHKGGVGKTTLAGAVSCELIISGKKVLMADTDSQGNLSAQFMDGQKAENELADFLSGEKSLEECVYRTRYDNLFIAPSRKISEKGRLNDWAATEAAKTENRNALEYLAEDAEKAGFDFLVLDMPPSYSELDKKVMLCSDEIVPVLQVAQTSIDGLVDFYQLLTRLRGRSERPLCDKLVFNQHQRAKAVQKALLPVIEKLQGKTFFIPNDEAFRKAELRKVAAQEIGIKKETQAALDSLVAEIMKNAEAK